jgi:hypothetical protein
VPPDAAPELLPPPMPSRPTSGCEPTPEVEEEDLLPGLLPAAPDYEPEQTRQEPELISEYHGWVSTLPATTDSLPTLPTAAASGKCVTALSLLQPQELARKLLPAEKYLTLWRYAKYACLQTADPTGLRRYSDWQS